MLQQTRVETVIPFFERFLARFPDAKSLASASEDEVLAAWSGLGYYRRARHLRRAAAIVVRDHDGRFPESMESAMALPGVGRYTAGAVLSIAHGLPEAVVDGNVSRVLGRVFGLRKPSEGRLWQLARTLVPPDRPGDFNQAMMELGATVCVPRSPTCPACPIATHCEASRAGTPERFGASRGSPGLRAVPMTVGVASRGGRFLLCRRQDGAVLRGIWSFPGGEHTAGEDPAGALGAIARDRFGVALVAETPLFALRHALMDRSLRVEVFRARVEGRIPRRTAARECRWVHTQELAEVPIGGLTKKILARLDTGERPAADGSGHGTRRK